MRQAMARMGRPRVRAALVAGAVGLVSLAAAGWYRHGVAQAEVVTARQRIPDLVRLVQAGKQNEAFQVARAIARVLPDDPTLVAAWPAISAIGTIESRPAGADVEISSYGDVRGEWIHLGRTPLENVRVPAGRLRIRATKDGYEPLLVARTGRSLVRAPGPVAPGTAIEMRQGIGSGLDLQLRDPSTARMVAIPALKNYTPLLFYGFPSVPAVNLPACWFDKFEVTNREYKMFVDSGAYALADGWPPFVRDGRTIPWSEGIRRLVDMTGRPGPAGWQLGDYQAGQEDLPVAGVSWFEAVAYARWAKKALPTAHDWIRVAATNWGADILPLSNVATSDRRPTGPVPNRYRAGDFGLGCLRHGGQRQGMDRQQFDGRTADRSRRRVGRVGLHVLLP
jgi:hypothetical protein